MSVDKGPREPLVGPAPGSPGASPTIMFVCDPCLRADLRTSVFGAPLVAWQIAAARGHRMAFARGIFGVPDGSELVSPGESWLGPALLVPEGSLLAPASVEQLLSAPLAADESWLVDDAAGKPCAARVGTLHVVPSSLANAATRLSVLGGGLVAGTRVIERRDFADVRLHLLHHYAGMPNAGWYRDGWVARAADWVLDRELSPHDLRRAAISLGLIGAGVCAVPGTGVLVVGTTLMITAMVVAELAVVCGRLVAARRVGESVVSETSPLATGTTALVRALIHAVAAVAVSHAQAQLVGFAAASAWLVVGAASAVPPLLFLRARRLNAPTLRWELAIEVARSRLPARWRDLPALPEFCLWWLAWTDSAVVVASGLAVFAAWRLVGAVSVRREANPGERDAVQ